MKLKEMELGALTFLKRAVEEEISIRMNSTEEDIKKRTGK